jgi:hypothetical protein
MLEVDPKVGLTVIYSAARDSRAIDIPWDSIEAEPRDHVTLAFWSVDRITDLLFQKFDPFGWAQITTDPKSNAFDSITFGRPVNTTLLFSGLINGTAMLDSGMTNKSGRNRFLFRGSRRFWNDVEDNSRD